VWEGASLWMLEGTQETAEPRQHSHHAIPITFLLAGAFEISVASNTLVGPIAAVASDTPHGFRANGAVAFLFVAPESLAGCALGKALFADRPWASVTSGPLEASLTELRACFRNEDPETEIRRLGRTILEMLPAAEEPVLPDRRVLAMIEFARQNLEGSVTLPLAAASVNLSQSRASHLFVAHTRLPFKAYVLWLRLQRAVAPYAAGSSLTEAAHNAGFADSAHFSRTFRRTFGLPQRSVSTTVEFPGAHVRGGASNTIGRFLPLPRCGATGSHPAHDKTPTANG
jgi:AraC family transcriptional regulator